VYSVYNVYELSVPCVQDVYSSFICPYTNTRALADRTHCTHCTRVDQSVEKKSLARGRIYKEYVYIVYVEGHPP
jgi:hypothetical protein